MELYFAPFGGAVPRVSRGLRRTLIRGGWNGRFGVPAIVGTLRLWRRRAYERRLLAQFGERERRDLALTLSDIRQEIAKPFWRG